MRGSIAVVAGVAMLLVACGGAAGGPGGSATSEPPGDGVGAAQPGADGEVVVELLGVQPSAGEMGVVEHAADQERYLRLWERFSFEAAPPDVDFDEHVVLFYARAEDGCPDEVGGAHLDGDRLTVEWRPPPGGCIQPLIPTAFALAVHRATVPQTFTVLLEGFHSEYDDIEHRVELPAYEGSGPAAAPARPTPPAPTEVTGTVELPPQGETAVRTLDDGTRVWVVHHGISEVSVLAADVPADVQTEMLSLRGVRTQVLWFPSPRRFGGGGRYDEYGVSLQGRSATNLDRYESAVDGSHVTVGQRLGPVPFDQPVTDDPDPGDGEPDWPDHPREVTGLSLDEARQRPEGSVVVIDVALVAYGDQPLRLCVAPEGSAVFQWEGCPGDAPSPSGVTVGEADADTLWVWHGPLRARVTDGGFAEITLLGGGHTGGRIGGHSDG